MKLFKNTIGVFENNSKYDLVIKNGECTDEGAVACTDASNVNSGEITIYIDDMSYHSLDIASNILHEGIHAELSKYVDEHHNGELPNDRPRLFQLYFFYKQIYQGAPKDKDFSNSDYQHAYMAEKYVLPLARAIRALDEFKHPIDYYMKYGWEGLEKYDFDNRLTKEKEKEYDSYKKIVEENSNFGCDE